MKHRCKKKEIERTIIGRPYRELYLGPPACRADALTLHNGGRSDVARSNCAYLCSAVASGPSLVTIKAVQSLKISLIYTLRY